MQPEALPIPPPPISPLRWEGTASAGALHLLDQTRLPSQERWDAHTTSDGVVQAIKRLNVRGAPAIGIAGAYALVLAAREARASASCREEFEATLAKARDHIGRARPTAVNLPAALARSLARASAAPDDDPVEVGERLLAAAQSLEAYERTASAAMGRHGAAWLWGRTRFLTHCNAGALVTSGIGTALAPIYVLNAAGEDVHVSADESRPLLQGLRLTAYELSKAGIPYRVLADGAAASLLRSGQIDAVITGADRICANGDVVNKIGTYSVALAAHEHGVPMMVVAPLSTLDPHTGSGADVVIEERPEDQRAYLATQALPASLPAYAPAFDATPARLITCLVSELGVLEHPDNTRLAPWLLETARLQEAPADGR